MATKTWTGSDGTFSTNELWFPSVAPGSGDIAVIDAGTVTAIGILPDLLVIDLNSSIRFNPTLVLSDAALSASSLLNINAGETDATLRVSGIVNSRGTITATSTGSGITFISFDDGPGGTATKFVNNGSIQLNDTGLRVTAGNNAADQFENNGLISIRSPSKTPQLAVIAANLTGTGSVVLSSFVTFEAVQAVSAAQTVIFEHGSVGATLRMDAGKRFGAAVSGFAALDTIQLVSGRWDTAAYAPTDANSGLLTLSIGRVAAKSIAFNGAYTIDSFKFQEVVPTGSSQAATTITVDDPLFDTAYYLAHNPDVAAANVDPYQHFMTYGWREGRNPNAMFDLAYYARQNPDVAAAGVNLLSHFEQYGWREGRDPSLAFSAFKYLAAYPDVRVTNLDPLLHFEQHGKNEGRTAFLTGGTAPADLLVDPAYYDRQLGVTIIPTGAAAEQQAAWSYDAAGFQRGLNPDAFFDTQYYLAQNPDIKAYGLNPLTHFEQYGWKEGRDPSLLFSASKYLTANPDVKAAGANPLLHYIEYGQVEGRIAFLPGNLGAADPLVNAAYLDRQLGATLIPTGVAAQQ